MRKDVLLPSTGKNLVFQIDGHEAVGATPRRLRFAAPSEAAARARALAQGVVPDAVACEGEFLPSRTNRKAKDPDEAVATVIAVSLVLFFGAVFAFGGWAWWQDHLRNQEKAAVAAAKLEAERGPEWEAVLAFAEGAIPRGSDGVGWFITRRGSGEPEMRYNATTSEYRIKIHTYPRGVNPLTGSMSDRLEGGMIVRGSGKNWSVVRLVPYW